MESAWNWYIDLFDRDPYKFGVLGLNAWGFIVFWACSLAFAAADFSQLRILHRYKVQEKASEKLTMPTFVDAVKLVLFNQLVVAPAFSFVRDVGAHFATRPPNGPPTEPLAPRRSCFRYW